jgi:hypothetical protein
VEKRGRAGQATDDNIIRRMRLACWITMATDTHPEEVILLAFARQQWFRECASVLRLYVHCLSFLMNAATKCCCFPSGLGLTTRSFVTLRKKIKRTANFRLMC